MGKERVDEPVDPAALARAAADQSFVKVKRRTGDSIEGFIVGVAPRWTAIALLAATIDLDGYALIRTPFVRRLKHLEPRAQFVREVLRVRNQWPPKALRTFDGTNDETLIRSLSTSYSLMSVYTEGERPDECYVGRPRDVTAEAVTLDEVDPAGRWLLTPATYRFAKVTRVDVGGRYEEALQIHAGNHPS